MVLQDKYKAKASKAWKASRGLSTAPKPTTRRLQPPEVDNQAEFPDLKKSDSSDGSGSENYSSEISQSEDKLAVPSASNNTTRRSTNPKYSRRKLVDNSSKYDEPATEQEEEEERDLSSITMKLKVDDDFEQYIKRPTDADDDDIDYDLANRHKKKEPQLLPIDSESSKALEEMRNDRMKAEASWSE
ncbi:hypothetical protein E3Q18_00843 [Wallemia mellicola]|uniref:Uncharacterized protein n=1 Tax=Wallemia mellicola TaxID=1708541 RepID=A0AB74KGY4_9BASI|nr:hypothetical protein E3Q23_00567 [Wallemia mellicola]TIB90433.1 hypothetical protein E3Q21_00186 [Wallemia mellicola]TIB92192.1 hypothetical protein E3Q20_00494 [Wallemia mellicola]TIC01180.1 hypothetical protein E3Q18_00843 [Wallemia mellicola]TIC25717.1 hypothetical protein E3Q12_00802 [Wallemia mellicola]